MASFFHHCRFKSFDRRLPKDVVSAFYSWTSTSSIAGQVMYGEREFPVIIFYKKTLTAWRVIRLNQLHIYNLHVSYFQSPVIMVIRHVAMILRAGGYASLCGVSRMVLAGFCLNGAVEALFHG
jgi:hypothetical protein